MDLFRLDRSDAAYPTALDHYLGKDAPLSVAALGNLEILNRKKLALFCSVRCPGALILKTHDLAQQLAQAGVTVIGGFHSPVEKECLRILLRGTQPAIICPGRSLRKLRMPKEWKKPVEEGRLLFLSPFPDNRHRGDTQMALYRNRFVAAIADRILASFAAPGSKTEQFCSEAPGWQKAVYTFSHASNENLIALGASPLTLGERVEISLALRKRNED